MFDEYIGIDLHKAFFQACAMYPNGERHWEDRFPTSSMGVDAFLRRCAPRSAVAIEATGPTWAFADQLAEHVAQLQVVDPRKTRLKAGYAAKTDRLDARRLADALRRESVAVVYYPPRPIRELRELCRYRCSLVRLQVAIKQRLHALLLRQGLRPPAVSDLFGQRGQRWLQQATIDGWAGQSLVGLHTLWEQVHTQLAPLNGSVAREVAHDRIAQALDQIPGVGAVLALMIRAEIGTIHRFPHPAQLASYAGLVPRVTQSGAVCRYGPITREGSPWLRWALIEAGIHGLKRRDALGRWARRLAVQKGGLKARVAVARLLCHEIFRVWQSAERLSGSAVEEDVATDRVADL